jgi:tape measure domain-containing protein
MAVGAANIKLGADISGFLAGVQQVSQKITGLTYQVNTQLADSFKRADTQARVFSRGLGRLGSDLQSIGAKMSLFATTPLVLGAGKSYMEFANLEKLKIGLDQYGESMEKVKRLAALPNISVEGAAQSLIMLRSVKVESQLAERTIKAFANAMTAAGKSSSDLAPALVNIQQIMASGKITAIDIKEMANRIPQARQALMEAFGTADSETLNKMGPEKIVQGLVAQLEKIPPVAGGAGMAMEKFQDASKFAFAALGESIDKAFGITNLINTLATSLDGLIQSFQALSPEAQKAILVIGAIVAAIGPLLVALGGLVTLWPVIVAGAGAVAAGLALVTAPVLAVAAAVALAVAAIIIHWDSIKAAMIESGTWDVLTGIIGSALNLISNLFSAVISLIKGDWAGFGEALKNIAKSAINNVIQLIGFFARSAVSLFAEINSLFGMDALANGLRKGVVGIDNLVKKITFDMPSATKVIDDAKKAMNGLNDATGGKAKGPTTLKDIEDAIAKLKSDQASVSTAKEYAAIQRQIEALERKKLAITGEAAKNIKSILADEEKLFKLRLEELEKKKESYQIQQAITAITESEASKVKKLTDEYKKLVGVVAGLNVEKLKGQGMNFEKAAPALGKLEGPASGMMQAVGNLPGIKAANDAYQAQINRLEDLNQGMNQAWTGARESAVSGMAELAGGLMAGVGSFADLPRMLGAILADLMGMLGKTLIGFGLAGEGIKKFITNPVTALVAGAALVALSGALKATVTKQVQGKIPAFAKGGMVYGDMVARVGDNPNARFDPEMIAPYSKVDKSIRDSIKNAGGGNGYIGELVTRVSGSDLEIVLNRTQRRRAAIG